MHLGRSLLIAGLLTLALQTAALAAPTAVDVRIEGKASTIFSGPVTTDGKVVSPATGGDHLCDGTNFGANPSPGPTPTTALHDAAIKGGFDWDADWFGPGFPDYGINRVADEPATATEFWGVFVNGVATAVGGCQFIVSAGDEVLWAFDAFSKVGALRLELPEATHTGETVQARVTDVATGAPVAGASVGGATTGADGRAALSFDDPGVYPLKADRGDYIRSRPVTICVDPPLVEACTSSDRTSPSARLDVPALWSTGGRFGTVRLSWQGDDGAAGSGIRRYRVERRRIDGEGGRWLPVAIDTAATEARVRASAGSAWRFRVQAFDRAGNPSEVVHRRTLMPVDNLSHQVRFSKRGWVTLRRQGAFRRTVARSRARGATARVRFTGTRALVVTRELRRGGRLRIAVDGEARVVGLRGRSKFRETVVRTPKLDPGEHVLTIRSVGRRPIEIDAIAIAP